jgi:hypothetical protein
LWAGRVAEDKGDRIFADPLVTQESTDTPRQLAPLPVVEPSDRDLDPSEHLGRHFLTAVNEGRFRFDENDRHGVDRLSCLCGRHADALGEAAATLAIQSTSCDLERRHENTMATAVRTSHLVPALPSSSQTRLALEGLDRYALTGG